MEEMYCPICREELAQPEPECPEMFHCKTCRKTWMIMGAGD